MPVHVWPGIDQAGVRVDQSRDPDADSPHRQALACRGLAERANRGEQAAGRGAAGEGGPLVLGKDLAGQIGERAVALGPAEIDGDDGTGSLVEPQHVAVAADPVRWPRLFDHE